MPAVGPDADSATQPRACNAVGFPCDVQQAAAVSPPDNALCLGCRYALRGLSSARCPECGRDFAPDDIETMYLPTWNGFLARRVLKRPRWLLYLWPLVAALLIFMAAKWSDRLVFSQNPNPYPSQTPQWVTVPKWTGIEWYRVDLWRIATWVWALLLLAWAVRASLRRLLVEAYRLPRGRLLVDRPARRFACACFAAVIPFGGYRADRCTYGAYRTWWDIIGVVRNEQGRYVEAHPAHAAHLFGNWELYVRIPESREH
jgi:hypothetical protein